MGGSTNTVLHLLAAAHEGGVDFTMRDIDRLSRRVPVLCKVAPSVPDVHVEDVHRAGGIMGILGELDRAGLIDTSVPTVHTRTLGEALGALGRAAAPTAARRTRSSALPPAACRRREAFSQSVRWETLDLDRERGVIRDAAHAYSKDGGLAVLYGNLAEDGCIVKTAGVDAEHPAVRRSGPHLREPGCRGRGHPGRPGGGGRRGADPLRGPEGRPRHAGDAVSDQLSEVEGAGRSVRPGHRRPLLRRHVGPVDRPCLAGSGRGRR